MLFLVVLWVLLSGYSAFFSASPSGTFPIFLYSRTDTAKYATIPKISISAKIIGFMSRGIQPDILDIIMVLNIYFKSQ